MADQNGWARKQPCCDRHVLDEITDACPAQTVASLAVAMSAQIDRVGWESVLREVIQKMGSPTPRSMQRAMHKKKWCRPCTGRRMSGDDFQFHRLQAGQARAPGAVAF